MSAMLSEIAIHSINNLIAKNTPVMIQKGRIILIGSIAHKTNKIIINLSHR